MLFRFGIYAIMLQIGYILCWHNMLSINQTLSCNWKCLLGKHYSPPIRTVGNIISCYPELVSSESKVKVNFGLLFCLCFIKVEVVFFWIGYANHLCLIFNVTLIKSALIRNLLNETIHLFRSTIYNPQQFTSQMWKSQKQQLVALSDVKNHVSDSFPNMLRSFCHVKGFSDMLQYICMWIWYLFEILYLKTVSTSLNTKFQF